MNFDKQLQRDLLYKLQWEPSLEASGISVSVRDSVVTLGGYVGSEADKQLAEEVVKGVPEIIGVANQIEVRKRSVAPAP
jgi:osmotically-inducible protein OsmY